MTVANLEPSKPSTTPPDYPMGAKGDRQALVALQRRMWRKAHDDSVAPHIQAACARVWRDLQETKRIMDGKPLPGQLRPDVPDKHRKTKQRPAPMHALPELAPSEDSRSAPTIREPKESLPPPDGGGGVAPEGPTGSGVV